MTAPARLLGLRLQGFKSFAERTHVEFGAGISAVVGPNGSGKSNLADALRWALGEQGRSLRIRRSEDVIWAGSERRAAVGMADVTLVLDNADALLPVDYGVVELGRRLYRSGENDYLLNRQRVRLRDLVDLLDAASLADNAFLFIGQGMVDQALALRPEERRPLFEEVAGVRRHERRRRKAEEQLGEAEANLARVEDVLAELRPQARRLGQLAEQQATRMTAGEELAAALVVVAHARWHEAAGRAAEAERRADEVGREGADALTALESAEAAVVAVASSLAARADTERERRATYEAARAEATALGLRQARAAGELEAAARDRARLDAALRSAEADLEASRRILAEPAPERDTELEAAVAEADRSLAAALAELLALRTATRARGEELAALRRAEAARAADAEAGRRRHADAERRAVAERQLAAGAMTRRDALAARLEDARRDVERGTSAEAAARAGRESAQAELDALEGHAREAADRAAAARSSAGSARAALEELEGRLAEEERRGIARAARRLGGRRLDEDLLVDPALRPAVEAALGDLARAYVLDAAHAGALAAERGALLIAGRLTSAPGASGHALDGLDAALAAVSGGRLGDAVRRDATGGARALLARAAWVPDLPSALTLQPTLPAGWIAVTRDGAAVVDALSVRLGRGDSPLERRAQAERLAHETAELERAAASAASDARAAGEAFAAARAGLERARRAESDGGIVRRRAEDAERTVSREFEAVAREAAWHAAQADRLAAEASRAVADVAAASDVAASRDGPDAAPRPQADATGAAFPAPIAGDVAAVTAWDARVAELRARRDRLAGELADHDRARGDAEGRRARADAGAALAEERLALAAREAASLGERERAAGDERAGVARELAAATAREAAARAALDALLADDRTERARLADAEHDATTVRERLRAVDERRRVADVAALETRLALDGLREQLLVELAGLGQIGLHHLVRPAGEVGDATDAADPSPASAEPATEDTEAAHEGTAADGEGAALEAALDAVVPAWTARPPAAGAPTPGRLAVLRRRYHELGAANPFAVDEYRTLRERLETLEGQDRDLREAVAKTRALIADLDTLIATRFRTTFAALETAFDRRFRQLFGGGFARLSLTDPADLTATGIEIVARPPGKKAQALAMLSGGERALTAVALLFSMLEVRPAPFCVLDEVDAALDEANVGRFTDALRELADATQFVVITHNRGTIEAADALYGVTVGDDSASRVISLRLDEARALADDGRDEDAVTTPVAVSVA